MQYTTFPPDPTTGRELSDLLDGEYAYRYRPADTAPGTYGEMLAYAMGRADRPRWSLPRRLPPRLRDSIVREFYEDESFGLAIKGSYPT